MAFSLCPGGGFGPYPQKIGGSPNQGGKNCRDRPLAAKRLAALLLLLRRRPPGVRVDGGSGRPLRADVTAALLGGGYPVGGGAVLGNLSQLSWRAPHLRPGNF